MSEKVKLHKEQAEELELQKKELPIHGIVTRRMLSSRNNKAFESIDLDTLIRALYIGYEVEPSIKIGDFVDIGLFGISKIAEVTGVKGNAIAINGSEEYHEFKINRVLTDEEKQEEKQRRWWAKRGREVWELRAGDILTHMGILYIVKEVNRLNSDVQIIWEENNGSDLLSDIKMVCKVACFSHDRLDVKTNG